LYMAIGISMKPATGAGIEPHARCGGVAARLDQMIQQNGGDESRGADEAEQLQQSERFT
jgi:hypothetical protein